MSDGPTWRQSVFATDSVSVTVDVVDILESFANDALASVILHVCKTRAKVRERVLRAWMREGSPGRQNVTGSVSLSDRDLQPADSGWSASESERGGEWRRPRGRGASTPPAPPGIAPAPPGIWRAPPGIGSTGSREARTPRAATQDRTKKKKKKKKNIPADLAAARRTGRGPKTQEDQASELLAVAISKNDAARVRKLLEDGASVHRCGVQGGCAAAMAMHSGSSPLILRQLLEARADLEERSFAGLGMVHLWCVQTLVTEADQEEAREKLSILVKAGADLQQRVHGTGDTPLHVVTRNLMHQLRTEDAATSSHRSFMDANFKLQLLITEGADRDQVNNDGKTPAELVSKAFSGYGEDAETMCNDLFTIHWA